MITDHVPAVHALPDTRAASWLRLSWRAETWKTAEILTAPPAHGPAAPAGAPPEPELGGPGTARDPVGVIPKARRHGLRLLVTPDTIVRWHRDIVSRHWAADPCTQDRPTSHPPEHQGPGSPAGPRKPRMGLPQHPRELAGLGVRVSASTVWKILSKAAIDPAPRRTGPAWLQFLPSQADAILACDFHSRTIRRHSGLRPGRDRARDPAHPHPRRHSAPNLWGSITGSPLAGSGPVLAPEIIPG
jgi:hypothetical protein